ncbi:MAG TPA: hypothetical protein VE596_15065 [Gaiellaceae bacterium]|jgi:hypothetical protein|nr:hypothetical protein [Gaiellaceae bacterium]
MPELELELREVGRLVAFPPEPDLVPAVRDRLVERPVFGRRRLLLVAFAALAVAVAAAFSVPPARTAILRFFHIGGETVERVEKLPPAERRSPVAGLAGPMSLSEARDRAGFEPLLPPRHGRIYAADGILATYLRPRVVLSEFRADISLSKKVAGPDTRIQPVTVNGHFGLWMQGAPHVITYFDSQARGHDKVVRLAGNVLVWSQGSLTLRLEGPVTRGEALRVAKTVG